MKTSNFLDQNFDQKINKKNLMLALKKCYKNSAFSTFPYIIRNYSSKNSINKFTSGNCVALSMYLKKYLKQKYNIKSFLIPATIPKMYSHPSYLNVSHVSLAIPKNNKDIYIIDPAFYFLNPIKLRLNSNKEGRIFSKNVYKKEFNLIPKDYDSIDRVIYQDKKLESDMILNKYQTIPKGTYYSKCYYCKDKHDIWNYYLLEILNPDKSISNFYSTIKFEPFIVSTKVDKNGICCSNYTLKVESNYIIIKKENNTIEEISFDSILKNPDKFKEDIKKYNLSKFFDDDLINGIIDYIKDIESNRKKININD